MCLLNVNTLLVLLIDMYVLNAMIALRCVASVAGRYASFIDLGRAVQLCVHVCVCVVT